MASALRATLVPWNPIASAAINPPTPTRAAIRIRSRLPRPTFRIFFSSASGPFAIGAWLMPTVSAPFVPAPAPAKSGGELGISLQFLRRVPRTRRTCRKRTWAKRPNVPSPPAGRVLGSYEIWPNGRRGLAAPAVQPLPWAIFVTGSPRVRLSRSPRSCHRRRSRSRAEPVSPSAAGRRPWRSE